MVEVQRSSPTSPSKLGIELSELALVDGEQTTLRTQLTDFKGGKTPGGQQAGTILQTTTMGAVVGAAAGWGTGAAIGAGTGALAGAIAVLMTRNQPTVIYPETTLTFRIDSPIVVSTARAPQAFRYVEPSDYNRPVEAQIRRRPPTARCYGCMPPIWGPVYDPYPYWGPYYGAGVVVGIGHGGIFGRRR